MDTNTNTPNTIGTFTKTIWVSKKPLFEKKLHHLNNILRKHGKSPISVSYANYRSVATHFTFHTKGESFANDINDVVSVEMCDAICTGNVLIKKDDTSYTYLGTVSIEDGIRQVFCKDESYARYFTDLFRDGYCDHCHTTRKNRKSYHLFLDPSTSKVLQIGSTCVKEYFGIDSTAFLNAYGDTFIVDYTGCDDDYLFSRGSRSVSYEAVLSALSYCTRGFLHWNKKDGYTDPSLPLTEQPTSSAVTSIVCSWDSTDPISIPDQSNNISLLSPNEVLDFWKAKYSKECSTFAFNCLSAIKAGYATFRTLGSFCYAIFAAFNAKVRSLQEAEAASKPHTPCPFPVSSRQTIEGVVTNIRDTTMIRPNSENFRNSYCGEEIEAFIVDFTADNGTLYHFATTSSTFSDIHANDRISLRATIGDTKTFRGVPYTRLSRPKATLLTSAKAA